MDKKAFETVHKMIEACQLSGRINGQVKDELKEARYEKLILLAHSLFTEEEMEITMNNPKDNTLPIHSITVSLEEFEITKENADIFKQMIELADSVNLNGTEVDMCELTFSVCDIWKESLN